MSSCPICAQAMVPDVLPGTSRCRSCGYFGSSFPVAINDNIDALDEDRRIDALSALRHENFAMMLDRVAAAGFPEGARALDVGCGHGWFLAALTARGHRAIGIEPDSGMAAVARAAGHEVIEGYFPSALGADDRFDAIFFNDTFEHLPAVNAVMEDLTRHTAADGWIVVNLPVSDGIIFRIARLLARLGLRGPYRRLWQESLPSPHLSYFSGRNIERLFARHGFRPVLSGTLRSVATGGLLDRIRFDRSINPALALAYYGAALALTPVLRLLPADIRFVAVRRTGGRAGQAQ